MHSQLAFKFTESCIQTFPRTSSICYS